MLKAQAAEQAANESCSQAEEETQKLYKENENLQQYIECLGQDVSLRNYSKKFSEIGDRQQRRKLKELKTNVERALCFAKTFGLNLENVSFLDDNGATHTLTYNDNVEKKSYKNLPEEEKMKIKKILFIFG